MHRDVKLTCKSQKDNGVWNDYTDVKNCNINIYWLDEPRSTHHAEPTILNCPTCSSLPMIPLPIEIKHFKKLLCSFS